MKKILHIVLTATLVPLAAALILSLTVALGLALTAYGIRSTSSGAGGDNFSKQAEAVVDGYKAVEGKFVDAFLEQAENKPDDGASPYGEE